MKRLLRRFEQWRKSRIELLREVATLRDENERLRKRVSSLQQAKTHAENLAADRRREKEILRAKFSRHQKDAESQEHLLERLDAKVTDLIAENDSLRKKDDAKERS